jgi:hypothetical protein
MQKRNWFNTLNDALDAEGLLESWKPTNPPLEYGETRQWAWDDGTRWGRWVSIYRNEKGRYERPVHYSRG